LTDLNQLEIIATELIHIFEINSPPVPIEIMLQRPKPDMWDEVDITELSVGFLKGGSPYAPRMSLARLLARHVMHSEWGVARGLEAMLKQPDGEKMVYAFARMLVMPAEMVKTLSPGAQVPITMGMHFEVPEEDAKQRLTEINNSAAI
jgi:hypothetical protein